MHLEILCQSSLSIVSTKVTETFHFPKSKCHEKRMSTVFGRMQYLFLYATKIYFARGKEKKKENICPWSTGQPMKMTNNICTG